MIRRKWDKIKTHKISHALIHLTIADLIYLGVMFILFLEQMLHRILHPMLCKLVFSFINII